MPDAAASPLKAYNVPFDSMEPTIPTGSDVIGDTSYYSKHEPKRWDVVVFTAPQADKARSGADSGVFIKRIVGLPGETIHLSRAGLEVNGTKLSVPSKLQDRFSSFKQYPEHRFGNESFKVPADSVFVMGDNAAIFVADSSVLGAVPFRNLQARVLASVSINWLS